MSRYRYPAAVAVAMILAGASGAALADDAPAPKAAMTKFDELLDSAGLTVSGYVGITIRPTGTPFSVIEATVQ